MTEDQKARRATLAAKGAYELAKQAFDAKRKQLRESGAWWDETSVVARLRERMERRAKRVAELYVVWEAAEEAELRLPYKQVIERQERMLELQKQLIAQLKGQLESKRKEVRELADEGCDLARVAREKCEHIMEMNERRLNELSEAAQQQHVCDLWLQGIV